MPVRYLPIYLFYSFFLDLTGSIFTTLKDSMHIIWAITSENLPLVFGRPRLRPLSAEHVAEPANINITINKRTVYNITRPFESESARIHIIVSNPYLDPFTHKPRGGILLGENTVPVSIFCGAGAAPQTVGPLDMSSWSYLSYSSLKNRRPLRLQRGKYRTPNENQERRKAGERGRAWRKPLCLCSHSVFLVSF